MITPDEYFFGTNEPLSQDQHANLLSQIYVLQLEIIKYDDQSLLAIPYHFQTLC